MRFKNLFFVALLPFLLAASPPAVIEGDTQTFMDNVRILGDMLLGGDLVSSPYGFDTGTVGVTIADLTLYVRTGGDDSNDCLSSGAACLTIQEAVDRIPEFIAHDIVVDVGAGTFDGCKIIGRIVSSEGTLSFVGVLDTPTLTTGTASGTSDGGSVTQLVDSGQTWTTDELIGMMLKIDGEYRFIWDNDGTTIEVVGKFSATASGKAYDIVEHKTVLDTAVAGAIGIIDLRANTTGFRTCMAFTDIKTSGGTAGMVVLQSDVASLERVRMTGGYYGFLFQVATGEFLAKDLFIDGAAADGVSISTSTVRMAPPNVERICCYGNGGRGINIDNTSATVGITELYTIDNTDDGVYIQYASPMVSLYTYFRSEGNGGTGITCWKSSVLDTTEVYIYNNTGNGMSIYSTQYVDIDSGTIGGNGGWGIQLDGDSGGDRAQGSFVSMWGTITVENNTNGGILLGNNSSAALKTVTGSGNGTWGVDCRTHSQCVVEDACSITGASGDATIDGGLHTLTWATDFASNLDQAVNMGNNCRIERKD